MKPPHVKHMHSVITENGMERNLRGKGLLKGINVSGEIAVIMYNKREALRYVLFQIKLTTHTIMSSVSS